MTDHLVAVVDVRLDVVVDGRAFRPARPARRAWPSARADAWMRGASAATARAKLLEQLELALEDALVGAEDLLFVLLQRRA